MNNDPPYHHGLPVFTAIHRAFTLIEMLAVIVILGMMMSVGVWSLGQAADQAVLSTLPDRWRIFDSSARLLARRSGSMVLMQINPRNAMVEAGTVKPEPDEFDVEDGASIRFFYGGESVLQSVRFTEVEKDRRKPFILFDQQGRSRDYGVEFTVDSPDRNNSANTSSTIRLQVSGITGYIRKQEDE